MDKGGIASLDAPTGTTVTDLAKLVSSLPLTADAWSVFSSAGVCPFCVARLAGCLDAAFYGCNEQDLRTKLHARFNQSDSCTSSILELPVAHNTSTAVADAALSMGGNRPLNNITLTCTLCLGLLQTEVPLLMTPRARPSAESRGPDDRTCILGQAAAAASPETKTATVTGVVPSDTSEHDTQADRKRIVGHDDDGAVCVTDMAGNAITKKQSIAAAGATSTAGEDGHPETAISTTEDQDRTVEIKHRHACLAEAIAECAASRGYTVSSFGITASVPACLAVRDAAFLVAYGDVLDAEKVTATTGTISVKDALKFALTGALQTRFGAPYDIKADFVVEVGAKAPEADAHAMELLGGPALSQSGPKPPGWPGVGRWAKKRQRREEHRNPGLTVGAVKKGLSALSDDGRDRMRRWADGLRTGAADRTGDAAGGRTEGRGGTEDGGVAGSDEGDGVARVIFGDKNGMDVVVNGTNVELNNDDRNGSEIPVSASAAPSEVVDGIAMASTATTSDMGGDDSANKNANTNVNTNANADTNTSSASVSLTTITPAFCEIAIRRQPLYFWGRYTKLSRSVPQTPWMKGFFSVQEAVSEPFEAFSGCTEGILHGAGREDVDVRMLGNGRPFSLELVDSLRTAQEIGPHLPALQEEVNASTGSKNVGGGVSISRLRPAGPGDLPSDVQRVGEGKRKHYRCVVWVSRAIGSEELKEMCDHPELVVQQSTPLRVLHRRTLLERPRSIFDMRAEWINNHFFVLDLTTSAGTYIKEFVHGDLGRTVPSVGSLLNCRADILQLDVTNVEDKWSVVHQEQTSDASKASKGQGALLRRNPADSRCAGSIGVKIGRQGGLDGAEEATKEKAAVGDVAASQGVGGMEIKSVVTAESGRRGGRPP